MKIFKVKFNSALIIFCKFNVMRYNMIKKINIFLVLLLLLVSISAVSAMDDNVTDISSNEAIDDTLSVIVDDNVGYNSEDILESSSYTITSDNYNQYFDSKGKLVSAKVNSGDTLNLDGSFSDVNFTFEKPVNVVGTSTNKMNNVMLSLLKGSSGSSVANLNIANTKEGYSGVFLNAVSNCTVKNCFINNTGKSTYCIAVVNGATYNNVLNNYLQAYGVTYGHGTRSTPPLLLSGSHYNYVANNHVEADDANGIYLSSFDASPIHPGGISNFNTIYNNTVHYNVLPTSWSYGIQVMGNNNTIKSNKVIGGYRGVSTAGSGNIITENTIINLTGADYNHLNVETGGEYGIVGAYDSIVTNNKIIGAKIISTGAGISVVDNSVVENNWVNSTLKGKGIAAGGSNVVIKNNIIFTESGPGVYEKDEGSGLLVESNNITSESGVGILIERLSSKRMPKNVTVIKNTISTSNKYAIDAGGVQADTSEIDPTSNVIVGSGLINSPAGVYDASKPAYIYKGTTHTITPSNIRDFIYGSGDLTPEIKDNDILNFEGTFSNEVIYITKAVKITGKKPVFYNSTFKVTSGGVLIENLTIINNEAERVNAWGIFVNEAAGVRIMNNDIRVSDPKAAYAVYVLQSSDIDVWNNKLSSEGDYLTFTLLSYACEDCNFANNTINTKGTGDVYAFDPEKCIDGNELVINGRSYCFDGNELVIDGKSYCLDGNELVIDGKSYCLDGNELVIDGSTYCIDGNEFSIDGTSYCLDGNELAINGVKYNLNSSEINIGGKTYCLDGNEVVIDGKSYCLDGNELVIDGKSYCLDGNELVIDGVRYCVDGNEYCMDGAHVVSEIYQTYGILLIYSSNNTVSRNNVTVTSKLDKKYPTTGVNVSQNSIVGIDSYFNCHNNVFSQNNVLVKGNDNYMYGMGILGYNTGHTAPEGQGASDNQFIGNTITLEGNYFTTGIIIGDESETTVIQDNVINAKSDVSYGITLEMSQKSTIENNTLTLNSQAAYLTQVYGSSDNIINNNVFKADGKDVYGILISNGNNNEIKGNLIQAIGTGEKLTVKNLDSIESGNAGIYLRANSTNNQIIDNNVTSAKNYAVIIDETAKGNVINNNYLDCEKGIGNDAVDNSKNNNVSDNYKYVANPTIKTTNANYLGTGEFTLTFDKQLDGAVVEFYDADNNYFNRSTVSNGVASIKYQFDASYVPAQYIFSAKLIKDGYKSSTYNMRIVVAKGMINLSVPDISIEKDKSGNLLATVVDEFGNPIKGVTVEFKRVNSAGRATPIGTAITNEFGVATLSYTPTISASSYNAQAEINSMANYEDAQTKFTLKVFAKQITGNKDYSVYYGNKVKYKVLVLDDSGNAVGSGESVVFKINGKTKTVKTDKNGYATYSAKLKAGKYTITAEYNGYKVSNSITFKPTLIAKNIVKKKAKTVKFSVKVLNKKGKVVKKKKVTFKIKGKKYTAKTNKKGIATVSLKKLKVGKFKITSSYGGCTIKNTIKIKK